MSYYFWLGREGDGYSLYETAYRALPEAVGYLDEAPCQDTELGGYERSNRTKEISWQLAQGLQPTASVAEYMEAMLPVRHDFERDGFITVHPKVR